MESSEKQRSSESWSKILDAARRDPGWPTGGLAARTFEEAIQLTRIRAEAWFYIIHQMQRSVHVSICIRNLMVYALYCTVLCCAVYTVCMYLCIYVSMYVCMLRECSRRPRRFEDGATDSRGICRHLPLRRHGSLIRSSGLKGL